MARRKKKTTGRTWLIRALVAIALGAAIGFAGGAGAVRMLQPPSAPDTAKVDSTKVRKHAAVDTQPATILAPPPTATSHDSVIVVPKLVGLEEGDARTAITRAGFTVGTILFKASSERAGTVLSSFPVPGESVPPPAVVNLILSDGKPRADTIARPPDLPESHVDVSTKPNTP